MGSEGKIEHSPQSRWDPLGGDEQLKQHWGWEKKVQNQKNWSVTVGLQGRLREIKRWVVGQSAYGQLPKKNKK